MTNRASARVWFIAILAAACAFRLPSLEFAPPPLQQDEASRLYDAWCLLETGKDRHGRRWPLFLESFGEGDWTAALSTYLTIPFVAVLGPRPLAVRLPDAICGVLTVAAVFSLIRRRSGPEMAVAGAMILALDPWHVSLCRTGHESGFAPFFLASALLALVASGLLDEDRPSEPASVEAKRPSVPWAAAAGLSFALLAWVYPATRLITPLFLVALLLIYVSAWRGVLRSSVGPAARRALIAAGIALFVGAAPLWITAFTDPARLAARARVTLFAQEGFSPGIMVAKFAVNYAANLSPAYMFTWFDELSGTMIDGSGLHLIVAAPLLPAGVLAVLLKARTSQWHRLLLAGMLIYPIPAALCVDWNPHSFRTVAGIVLHALVMAEGWQWLAARGRARLGATARRSIAVAAALALCVNAAYFAGVYFRRMPPRLEAGYQTALIRAIQFVRPHAADADFILVTRWFNQPYIYAMLFAPIPPAELAASPVLSGTDLQGFHQINRIGKYYFPPRAADETPELAAAFQTTFNSLPPDAEGLVIELAGRFGGGKVLASFPTGSNPDGGPALEVRRWRRDQDPTPVSKRESPDE